MREGWKTVILEEVAEVVGGGTPSTKEPSYWGGDVQWITPSEITAQEGRIISKTERTLTTAGLENSSAKLLPPGTVLLTSRATIGAVARAGAEMATNQGFASLVPRRDVVLPQYLMYWCQLNKDEFIRRAGGNTFKEVSKKKVASVPLSIPPLAEQQRIVDLISSIDQAIQRAESEATSLMSAREALSAEFFYSREGNSTRIDELLETSIGGVWGDDPGESETDVRVYRSTEFTNEGWLDADGGVTRSITERQLQSRRLHGGDILLEKSGGGPNQPVGRVVWVPRLEHDSVCANFVQLIRPDTSKVDALYLWHLLWWWHRSGKTEQFQRRTTGIRNLQTKDYLGETISLPERDDQQRVIDILNDVEETRLSALIVRERLSILRADVLSELLSGEHEIPDSYDRLLEEAS